MRARARCRRLNRAVIDQRMRWQQRQQLRENVRVREGGRGQMREMREWECKVGRVEDEEMKELGESDN
ncbi:uncharacterized protein G2W53_010529 [Senna tora]|uniref:Uncharacterized protein n=1 Tax=Senna tora TaxID=362788 RepID=A0A834WZF9_9FABA|nr:uncharacterized protein G2W53_010529 [Senna tora]